MNFRPMKTSDSYPSLWKREVEEEKTLQLFRILLRMRIWSFFVAPFSGVGNDSLSFVWVKILPIFTVTQE